MHEMWAWPRAEELCHSARDEGGMPHDRVGPEGSARALGQEPKQREDAMYHAVVRPHLAIVAACAEKVGLEAGTDRRTRMRPHIGRVAASLFERILARDIDDRLTQARLQPG